MQGLSDKQMKEALKKAGQKVKDGSLSKKQYDELKKHEVKKKK